MCNSENPPLVLFYANVKYYHVLTNSLLVNKYMCLILLMFKLKLDKRTHGLKCVCHKASVTTTALFLYENHYFRPELRFPPRLLPGSQAGGKLDACS